MLCERYFDGHVTEFDDSVFRALVPADHFVLKALTLIDWDSFYEVLTPFYSQNFGRPAARPILMLKL